MTINPMRATAPPAPDAPPGDLEARRLPELAAIKRGVYLVGLPIGAVTAALVWWLEGRVGVRPLVDEYGLPLLALLFAALWFAFRRARSSFVGLELTLFGSFSVFLIASMYGSLRMASPADVGPVYSSTGYWFPVLYGMAFLMFGERLGRLLSLLLLGISLGLGLTYGALIDWAFNGHDGLILAQLYIANGLVLLLLNGFAVLTRRQHERSLVMERSAHTDSLTGLGNRRELERVAERELERAERYGKGFALLLFDLDHFKAINDRYGHDVGDDVLRELSRVLRFHVRQIDSFCRWGGEEFIILAPELSYAEAEQFALRLLRVVAQHDFAHVGRLTVSFGVSAHAPGDTLADLCRRADAALYAAKAAGRNRVVMESVA